MNSRNGYRRREWDSRVGSIGLEILKLRSDSYFPDWLLQRRPPVSPQTGFPAVRGLGMVRQ
jgi:transposase-like protein